MLDNPASPGLVLRERKPAGHRSHIRDRWGPGHPLHRSEAQPEGGARDLDGAADDRLGVGRMGPGVPGERLLLDAELLLEALDGLDEVLRRSGVLIERHHHATELARDLRPADRAVAAGLRLQALGELVGLGRVDPAELDVGVASGRLYPPGAASPRAQKAAERVEKAHGSCAVGKGPRPG
jgi:hypothetical protein